MSDVHREEREEREGKVDQCVDDEVAIVLPLDQTEEGGVEDDDGNGEAWRKTAELRGHDDEHDRKKADRLQRRAHKRCHDLHDDHSNAQPLVASWPRRDEEAGQKQQQAADEDRAASREERVVVIDFPEQAWDSDQDPRQDSGQRQLALVQVHDVSG
jgi:hypothetical protein